MRSIIRRKFSKDLPKKGPDGQTTKSEGKKTLSAEESETVVRHQHDGPKNQLKITKSDIRRDLLSDKKPEEGGYDSDAEVLDIAKNIGKRTPIKRPSIHSIDWTPSTGRSVFSPSLSHI